MKKIAFTLLALITMIFCYGQKSNNSKDVEVKTSNPGSENTITITAKHIVMKDRLDLEADSAQYNPETKILTAFGTKQFAFKGKVVVDKSNHVVRFHLADAKTSEAIIKL